MATLANDADTVRSTLTRQTPRRKNGAGEGAPARPGQTPLPNVATPARPEPDGAPEPGRPQAHVAPLESLPVPERQAHPAPVQGGIGAHLAPVAGPDWPLLGALGLSADEVVARRAFIGGSDANVILSGDADRVRRLWREKRGEDAAEDLSGKLAVMLGCWTEPFNRQWYERQTGHAVTRAGEAVRCGTYDWRTATLDGYVEALGAVFEAKHTSAFSKPDELLARYMPQLQHTLAVTGCERAVLSVIFGNGKWESFEVAADWLYQADLLAAEQHFRDCVHSGEPPVAMAPPPPPKPVGVREVCLEGNNRWASSAADWLQHRMAAKKHAEATVAIKELVEEDVARAFGHGIEARRSKAGALSIREHKA